MQATLRSGDARYDWEGTAAGMSIDGPTPPVWGRLTMDGVECSCLALLDWSG